MDINGPNYLNSLNSGKRNNKEIKSINNRISFKHSKIKPRNIFKNNKLFAYQKASGNIILLKKLIHQTFIDKYYQDKNFYNSKVIEDIINNEPTHVVAEFKDYLIFGDDSEFLQKNYNNKEIRKYLPKIFNYYESCSVIFPNYVILPESKYIYKNIQKKQKVIDIQQEQEEKLEKIKNGLNKAKNGENGKNDIYNLFNTKAINSILGQTNTSNINKIFGINNGNKNENDNENSEFLFNKIINELGKIEEKKPFQKKNINLIKKNGRMPSLNLNKSKEIKKQELSEKGKNNKDKMTYKKKTYIIINKQNNNIKYLQLKKKSLSKRNEENKSNLILNNSKKYNNNIKKISKENKKYLTNENTTQKIYNKIPKSKLSIDLGKAKKHLKIKSNLNDQDILNQKGISFFNDILKKKILKRQNSKSITRVGKSSSKVKKKVNSFIPSQKQLLKLKNKKNYISKDKSIKKNKDKSNTMNYSSPSLPKDTVNKTNIQSNTSRAKIPFLCIKDSNSSTNILKNNLVTTLSKSIIKRLIKKKDNTFNQDNYNDNFQNNEITSESNINININTLSLTDREKSGKKIYFTIAPHINNMINLNKIKYMIRTTSRENIINNCNNDNKINKNSKNKLNVKDNMVNKKNIYNHKKLNCNNIKKNSYSFKSSYKNSNTQISSSIGTAACSFGKNSHLMDFETIQVYKKRTGQYPNLMKPKRNINQKIKNTKISQRKFSLSPDKIESNAMIKKMLLNYHISNSNLKKKINNNKLEDKKRIPLQEKIKKQKNVVLPIRKEKDNVEAKFKDMIHLIINNKDISNNYGSISRNIKIKNNNKEKSIITMSNRTNNSINTNESNKNIKISGKTAKNSNSSNKNKNKPIFPYNKTYYG